LAQIPEDKKRQMTSTEIEIAKDALKEYPEYGIIKKKLQVASRMYETIVKMVGDLRSTDLQEFDNVPHTQDLLTNIIPQRLSANHEKLESYKTCIVHTNRRWEKLIQIFGEAKEALKGRDEELNSILHTIVAFSNNFKITQKSYLNYALLGPAGTGKTTLANYIGKLFAESGILITGTMREATRTDLIGQHLGETAPRTSAVLEATREGVLFLDEVYALTQCMDGAEQISQQKQQKKKPNECPKCAKWDPYGIEAVNTIVPFLSNNQGMIVVIVAGYTEDTWCTFFQANEGIPRRFPNVFILKALSVKDLMNVFYSKLRKTTGIKNLTLTDRARKFLYNIIDSERDEYFNNGGGDIENLVKKVADVISNNEDNHDLKQLTPAVNMCLVKIGLDQYLWDKKGAKINCGENCKCDEKNGEEDKDKLQVDRLPDPERLDETQLKSIKRKMTSKLLNDVKEKLSRIEATYKNIARQLRLLRSNPPKTEEDLERQEKLEEQESKLAKDKENLVLLKQRLSSREGQDELKQEILAYIQENPTVPNANDTIPQPMVDVVEQRIISPKPALIPSSLPPPQLPLPQSQPLPEQKRPSPIQLPPQLPQSPPPQSVRVEKSPEQRKESSPIVGEKRVRSRESNVVAPKSQPRPPSPQKPASLPQSPRPSSPPQKPKTITQQTEKKKRTERRSEGIVLQQIGDVKELVWPKETPTRKDRKDRIQRAKRRAADTQKETLQAAVDSGKSEEEAKLIANNAYKTIYDAFIAAEKERSVERRERVDKGEDISTSSKVKSEPFSIQKFLERFGIRYTKPTKPETPPKQNTPFKSKPSAKKTQPTSTQAVEPLRMSSIAEERMTE
jgi:hypothetical protein